MTVCGKGMLPKEENKRNLGEEVLARNKVSFRSNFSRTLE